MFFFAILFAAAGLLNALTPPPVLPPNSAEVRPYGNTDGRVRITYTIDRPMRVDLYKSYEGNMVFVSSIEVHEVGTYSSIFPAVIGPHDAAYTFRNGDRYIIDMWDAGNLAYHQDFYPSRVFVPLAANGGQ